MFLFMIINITSGKGLFILGEIMSNKVGLFLNMKGSFMMIWG